MRHLFSPLFSVMLFCALSLCGSFLCLAPQYAHAQYKVPPPSRTSSSNTAPFAATTSAHIKNKTQEVRIFAFGDSLMAGYGIGQHAAFPAILQQELRARGYHTLIHNAGKSGDTTASGLQRLPQELNRFPQPDLAILALGANDYLRRIPTDQTTENLAAMLQYFEQRKIPVFMIGVKAYVHPNPLYRWRFQRIFSKLAKKHAVGFMPDFLEGVVQNPAMNIEDGIHPNPRGVAVMVDNALPLLIPSLDRISTKQP